jgi:hypothetical protein
MAGELKVGSTLSAAFDLYRENAGVLLPVAFWLFLIAGIVSGLAAGNLALFPLQLLVSTVIGTLYQGMVVGLVRDAQDGRRDYPASELLRSVRPAVAPLIAASILSSIGIIVGFFLLVVPGFYLVTIWAVIVPAIVIERCGVFDAFRRSRQLVKGWGWPVLGTVVVAYLIGVVADFTFLLIATNIADGPILRVVFNALAGTLAAPLVALVVCVLYFRLRQIEERGKPEAPLGPEPVLDPEPGSRADS